MDGSCRLTVRYRRHLRKVEKIKKFDKPMKKRRRPRWRRKKRMITMALKRPLVRRLWETKN